MTLEKKHFVFFRIARIGKKLVNQLFENIHLIQMEEEKISNKLI